MLKDRDPRTETGRTRSARTKTGRTNSGHNNWRSVDLPEGFQEADEWLELNMWVHQFIRVMEKVMAAYADGSERCMHEGKIIRTPYGGRIAYKIAGYPFIIHLKNAELVQRGKRWSQGWFQTKVLENSIEKSLIWVKIVSNLL